jgi:hypothetical protein
VKSRYKQHLLKHRRQKALNDLVEFAEIIPSDKWSYISTLFEKDRYLAYADGKEMPVFLISKSDNLSIKEIKNLRLKKDRGEIMLFCRGKRFIKNCFSYIYSL